MASQWPTRLDVKSATLSPVVIEPIDLHGLQLAAYIHILLLFLSAVFVCVSFSLLFCCCRLFVVALVVFSRTSVAIACLRKPAEVRPKEEERHTEIESNRPSIHRLTHTQPHQR